jgi:hypothetical protein
MGTDGMRAAVAVAVIGLGIAAPLPALAAEAVSDRAAGAQAPDPASGITKTLVDPSNGGVAGTGLGKMSPTEKDGAGTGMSVKGPPGMGVDLGRGAASP